MEPAPKKEAGSIYDIIEQIFKEEKISFEKFPIHAGMDVRYAKCYAIKLPARKAEGLKGLFGIKTPMKTLPELAINISMKTGEKPSVLTDKVAHYIVTLPKEQMTDYVFLDVARIEVDGYFLKS